MTWYLMQTDYWTWNIIPLLIKNNYGSFFISYTTLLNIFTDLLSIIIIRIILIKLIILIFKLWKK